MLIRMSTWTVLKDLMKKNCLLENIFGDDGKKSSCHISVKDYLTCVWINLE